MKRFSLVTLAAVLLLMPLSAAGDLLTEVFWRSTGGTLSSVYGKDTFKGTEMDVRITSAAGWDGGFALSIFGGVQRALSLTMNNVKQDISGEKPAWYYGTGTTLTISMSPYFSTAMDISYEQAWQFWDAYEMSLDTLRVALRALTFTESGFYFSAGFEYSKPLWGRLFDRSGPETEIVHFSYDASGWAISVGAGFYVW